VDLLEADDFDRPATNVLLWLTVSLLLDTLRQGGEIAWKRETWI
jgi:hypothetical protein